MFNHILYSTILCEGTQLQMDNRVMDGLVTVTFIAAHSVVWKDKVCSAVPTVMFPDLRVHQSDNITALYAAMDTDLSLH